MKRKWNLWLVLVAIIPLAILIGMGLPLIPFVTEEEAVIFAMEDDFSKDLRIELPRYKIENHDSENLYDSDGRYIYTHTTYSIRLEEPLSEESLNILKKGKRGWHKLDGEYHLKYNKRYALIECCLRPNFKYLEVTYSTGGELWILMLCMILAIPAMGWLCIFLVMSRL